MTLRPVPHYPGGIWKRGFRSEDASNNSRPDYPGEFKNATINCHSGFVFEERKSVRKSHAWLSWLHHLQKGSFLFFSANTKTKVMANIWAVTEVIYLWLAQSVMVRTRKPRQTRTYSTSHIFRWTKHLLLLLKEKKLKKVINSTNTKPIQKN